jgi:hypothetical protein
MDNPAVNRQWILASLIQFMWLGLERIRTGKGLAIGT